MRRKDKEITDLPIIENVIKECNCCRIGFIDQNEVYIVPLNYGYKIVDSRYTLYFHGAKEGRKIDLIHGNPKVGFEMDIMYGVKENARACSYSTKYRSIIGTGVVRFVTDEEEKKYGLLQIMEHNTGRREWELTVEMLNSVEVFKLEVEQLSCKESR